MKKKTNKQIRDKMKWMINDTDSELSRMKGSYASGYYQALCWVLGYESI